MFKHINIKYIALSLGLLGFVASCDHISEDDRYIETTPVVTARKVLLEEFTGQFCPNCPEGHAVIESLEEQYGDELIVVSIHAGHFGVSAPAGLMEPEGDEYANRWGIEAYPSAVVDRNSGALGRNQWSTAVRDEISKETTLYLGLYAEQSADYKNIEITTNLGSPEARNGSLQLWVVENDIVTFQQDGGNIIPDYTHNNVFRACVNGLWGQEVALPANEEVTLNNSIAIQDDWVLRNVYIVGFYYDASGVIQVERCPVSNL
ncbi:MAG: Omp28 family outer membrane lipoprotein [Muribaculaceae bacterium]|nr:Omp28 family outer membrane lipoprotein [Muribaculaceae bacterium]